MRNCRGRTRLAGGPSPHFSHICSRNEQTLTLPELRSLRYGNLRRRGEPDEARSALEKADDLWQEPQWQASEMPRDLLREARQLVLGTDTATAQPASIIP